MEMLSAEIVPYALFSASIAAIVLAIRNAIPRLKNSKVISSLLPLVLGGVGGYFLADLAPKDTTVSMRIIYGLLAGSFSAPIYHAVRRVMANKLKGDSKRQDAGMETSFADLSAIKLPAVKSPSADKISAEKQPGNE
jgi:hypothetical protein